MLCSNCKMTLADDAATCRYCGKMQDNESIAPQRGLSRRTMLFGLAGLGGLLVGGAAGSGIFWLAHPPKPPAVGTTLYIYRGHTNYVLAAEWSRDGTRIASGGFDRTVQVWHPDTGERVVTYRDHTHGITTVQ